MDNSAVSEWDAGAAGPCAHTLKRGKDGQRTWILPILVASFVFMIWCFFQEAVWAHAQSEPEMVFESGSTINAMALSSDRGILAVGTRGGELILYDLGTRKAVLREEVSKCPVVSLAFEPDGCMLLIGADCKRSHNDRQFLVLNLDHLKTSPFSEGDYDGILTIAVSQKNVALGNNLGHLLLLRRHDRRLMRREAKAHSDELRAAAFSTDGKYLATGGGQNDRTVKLWRPDTNFAPVTIYQADSAISRLAFTPDGRLLLAADRKGYVYILAHEWPRLIKKIKTQSLYTSDLVVSSDGKYFVTGGESEPCRIWDFEGSLLLTFQAHPPGDVHFAAGEKHLVSSGSDGIIKVWSMNGLLTHARSKVRRELIEAVQKNDLDRTRSLLDAGVDVNTTDSDGAPLLMEAVANNNLDVLKAFIAHGAYPGKNKAIYCKEKNRMCYGSILGIAAGEGFLDIVRYLVDEVGLSPDDEQKSKVPDMKASSPLQEALAHDHAEAAGYLLSKGAARDWTTEIGKDHENRVGLLMLTLHSGSRRCAKLLIELGIDVNSSSPAMEYPLLYALESQDFEIAAALLARRDVDIKVIDARGRSAMHFAVASNSLDMVRDLTEKGAAVDTPDYENVTPLMLAERLTFKDIATFLKMHNATVNALTAMGVKPEIQVGQNPPVRTTDHSGHLPVDGAGAGEGRTVFIGAWGGLGFSNHREYLTIWDISTGRLVGNIRADQKDIGALAVDPRGRFILTANRIPGEGNLKAWDPKTGNLIKELQGHTGSTESIAVSASGRFIVSGGHGGVVRIWDGISFKLIDKFTENGPIDRLAFSPDDRFVAVASSTSGRGDIRIRNILSGALVREINAHESFISSVCFDRAGKRLLSAGSDGTVKLWDVQTGELVRTDLPGFGPIHEMAVDDASKTIATCHSSGMAALMDFETGKLLWTLKAHDGPICSVAFNLSGSLLATLDRSNILKLWSTEAKSLVSTFYSAPEASFAVTSEGFITGIGKLEDHIRFRKGTGSYRFSELMDIFHRPDIVSMKLQGKDISKFISGMAVKKTLAEEPPKARFLAYTESGARRDLNRKDGPLGSYQEVTVKGPSVGLELRVEGNLDQAEVGNIRIYQEGKLIDTIGKNGRSGSDTHMVNVDLKSGRNEIGVETGNVSNTVAGYRETVVVNSLERRDPELYAILIGIDEYPNSSLNLYFAEKDAKAMSRVIKRMGVFYARSHIHTLVGKHAAKADILELLSRLKLEMKPDDTFVFYASGHASQRQGELKLPTSDGARLALLGFFKSSDKLKPLNQVYIIDACHSGAVSEMASSMYDTHSAFFARTAGIHLLLSSAKGRQSKELRSIGHGLFTYMLLKGLSDPANDFDHDGTISISELMRYLNEKPLGFEQYGQRPVLWSMGKDLPLAKAQ